MELVAALLEPAAYPEPTRRVELIQTHISYIFLTDRHAYKLKKPVDFGFLDFSTLRKRHYYLEQELVLNRRLAPEIYLAVLPIVVHGGQARMGAAGHPREYALQMVRMPQEAMMDAVAARGELNPGIMDRLIAKLVPFYAAAATGPRVNKFGQPAVIAYNHEESFAQVAAFIGRALSRTAYDDIAAYSRGFLAREGDLFARRIRDGRIRDCHGDLHMENICLANGLYIFDCIEFNYRFRYSDVAADIDFLAMDLDFHGLESLGEYFVSRFAAAAGDPEIVRLVNFYKCYRAYVRGKINAFASQEAELTPSQQEQALRTARAYFELAWRYARQG